MRFITIKTRVTIYFTLMMILLNWSILWLNVSAGRNPVFRPAGFTLPPRRRVPSDFGSMFMLRMLQRGG